MKTHHATHILVLLVHNILDILQLLLSVMKKVDAANPGAKDTDAKLSSCAVEVVPNLWVRSTRGIGKATVDVLWQVIGRCRVVEGHVLWVVNAAGCHLGMERASVA